MAKVLIVADRGTSCIATSRGLAFAAKLGYSAEVVAFVHAPLKHLANTRAEQDALKRQILERREAEVRERIDNCAEPDQKVALKVVWLKDIYPWILRRAAAGFSLVVKTGHRSGNFAYTSTDWHLLRECAAPVMITAEKKWHRTRPVLAALDLGTRSKVKRALNMRIIEESRRVADALGVELQLLSAIDVPTLLADLDLVDPATYAREHRESMLPYIRELAEASGIDAKRFRTKRGPVDKVITSEAARIRAQLVVMGTVGRQGVRARLVGNTAEAVLQGMNTDVLAIRP